MSDFTRYTPADGFTEMEEDPEGCWVLLEDVEAELASAKGRIEHWKTRAREAEALLGKALDALARGSERE